MIEIVLLGQQLLQAAQHHVVIGVQGDRRMQSNERSFRGERPQVDVMHVEDARNRLRQVLAEATDVEALGGDSTPSGTYRERRVT